MTDLRLLLIYLWMGFVTWRVTSFLVSEDGPRDIFVKIRHRAGMRYDSFSKPYGTGIFSKMLMCVWCASVWVGFGVGIIWRTFTVFHGGEPLWTLSLSIFDTLVLSTIAILVDKMVS